MPRLTPAVRSALADGVRGAVPLALGVGPFGIVVGVASVDQGLSVAQAAGLSLFVFAGASQLAALDLIAASAPIWVIVGTMLVINARLVMYSASVAPYLARVSRPRRLGLSYILTDQVFALGVTRWETEEAEGRRSRHRLAYALGVGVPLWAVWQVTTVIGAVFGAGLVPESIPIDFAVPLVFLTLLVPVVTDRPRLGAAVVAAVAAVALRDLPANLGLPLGAISGIAVGTWLDARRGAVRRATPADPPEVEP